MSKTGSKDIHAKNEGGETPLFLAIKNGDEKETLLALLEKRAEIKTLVDAGVDIHASNKNGETILHKSAAKGYIKTVEALLKEGASVYATNKDRRTSLHLAAQNGHEEVVKLLVENGAEINAKDKDGKTALQMATENNYLVVMHALLAKGAKVVPTSQQTGDAKDSKDIHAKGTSEYTPLQCATAASCTDVNAKDKDGKAPLSLAIQYGDKKFDQLSTQVESVKTTKGAPDLGK